MWNGTKVLDDAWALLTWFNGDEWYDRQTRRLQPARLSWMNRWLQLAPAAIPEIAGKNLKAFTKPAEENYARPNETFRYRPMEMNQLVQAAHADAVEKATKPLHQTLVETAGQINRIQQMEFQAAGGKRL